MLTIANHNFLTIKKSTMSKHLSVKCTHLHLCSLSMVFMLLFLPCMAIKATSQNLTVSGVVTSASDKMPLIGVSVLVKGTTNGTITDFDGKYSLGVENSQTLVFSYILKPEAKYNGVIVFVIDILEMFSDIADPEAVNVTIDSLKIL